MLTVITWLWTGWRPVYSAEHVNTFCRMFRAKCTLPHRIICIAEPRLAAGISECFVFPLWAEWPNLQTNGVPNCYRRLRLLDARFTRDVLGAERVLHCDLDVVFTRSPDALLTNDAPFKIVKGLHSSRYNGSMWLLNDLDALQHVWDSFDPHDSPLALRQATDERGRRLIGSDQAWISHTVPDAYTWNAKQHGVYQYTRYGEHRALGNDVVWFFAGGQKPWHASVQRSAPELHAEYMRHADK